MLEGGKIIKKILSMLIICIIFLNSFLVVAIPTNNKIKNNPLNSQEFQLKIVIESGFLGYSVKISNTGLETIKGNLTIQIITDAMVVLFGENLTKMIYLDMNPLYKMVNLTLRPLIGFGSATMDISCVLETESETFRVDTIANGYAFVLFVICDETTIFFP